MKIYTTGEMIQELDYDQFALQVSGEVSEINGSSIHAPMENGETVYYDRTDSLLKSKTTLRPIAIFKSKNAPSTWVIVDLENK